MSFLNPWALLGALALLPLVLAFMSRRHVRRRRVPSLLLYRALQTERAARRRFAKLRHIVAFLLCLVALLALVFGVSDPREEGYEERGVILVVDTSASMGARDPGEKNTRLTRAVEALEPILDGQRAQDWTALVTVGRQARLMVRPTHDRPAVETALDALVPLGQGGAESEVEHLITALCREPERTRVVYVSDGTRELPSDLPCPVETLWVGGAADNLAVTALTVREADALGLSEVYVEVLNAGRQQRTARVELVVGAVLVEVFELDLGPGERRGKLLRSTLPEGEIMRAQLKIDDALRADNSAYVALSRSAPAQVLLVSRAPNRYLEDALRLHPRASFDTVSPDALETAGDAYDLIILSGDVDPAELPLAPRVVAFQTPAERFGLSTVGGVQKLPVIHRWDFEHTLLRYVDLDGLKIARASFVELTPESRPMIESEHGVLGVLTPWAGRDLFYLGFSPQSSDLVLRVAFVNLIANLVEWAKPAPSRDLRDAIRVGERLPGGTPEMRLVALDGEELIVAGDAEIPRPGVYLVEDADAMPIDMVAVNMLAPSESRLSLGEDATPGSVTRPEPAGETLNPWRLLLMLALGILMLEWLLPAVARPIVRARKARLDAIALGEVGGEGHHA